MPISFRMPFLIALTRRAAVGLVMLAAALPMGSVLSSAVADPAQLAIQGYDPVAYFTLGRPTPGSPDIEHEWDGYRWRFANETHRNMFQSDPGRYTPQFGNWCAMALSLGLLVRSDPQQWMIHDSRLYLFGSPAPKGPALFRQDLANNIVKANKNRTIIPPR
jgi:hypothetical protein